MRFMVTSILCYRKVSARWFPRQLTRVMKAQRKEICTELLKQYDEEGEALLQKIVTDDESWVHHYDLETKLQSME